MKCSRCGKQIKRLEYISLYNDFDYIIGDINEIVYILEYEILRNIPKKECSKKLCTLCTNELQVMKNL